ncbi:hypothetical protein ABVT39_026043 [Epinephelus coioides]
MATKVGRKRQSPIWDFFEYDSEKEKSKCLVVETDNGSNIVKVVWLLRDRSQVQSEECTDGSRAQPGGAEDVLDELWIESESEETDEEDEEIGETGDLELDLPDDGENNKFQRMPCLAHTLQLTLKAVTKHPNADSLISRARKLVHTVRKSSVANEAMIKKCGKTLVRDYQLQSDSQSLSQVVPCLLNLEAHLLTTAAGKQLAQVLLKSLRERFAAILSPDSPQFDATPAAACLLDPSVSLILQTPDMVPLRRAAQSLVQNLAAQYNPATPSQDNVIATQTAAHSPPTVLQKYRFLASRMEVNASLTNEPEGADSLLTEMKKYGDDVKQGVFNETPLQFWRSREAVYPKLAPVALDLVSAPASQAFVERIFSVCGLLSSGLRNRTITSLEQRVFLKINKKFRQNRTNYIGGEDPAAGWTVAAADWMSIICQPSHWFRCSQEGRPEDYIGNVK